MNLALSSSNIIPAELSNFNPFFVHLSEPSLLCFAKVYFGLFSTLYPGLANVPLLPTDVLHMMGDDPAFFPNQFILMSTDISRAFGDSETFYEFANVEDWSLGGKTGILKIMFEWAMWRRSYYTIEAFFETGLESFTQENLLFALELSRELGDLRMVNRIASELDSEACQELFSSELRNCSWPKYEEYSLMDSNILTVPIYRSSGPSLFEFIEVLGKVEGLIKNSSGIYIYF